MGLWSFIRRRKPKFDAKEKRFMVRLHHRSGNVFTIKSVSKSMLDFIRTNIGRDAIYAQEEVAFNLRDYSLAEVADSNAQMSDS